MNMEGRRIFQKDWNDLDKLIFIILFALSLIGFGLLVSSPQEIISGLYQIIVHPDNLITDYIVVGGIGGAFVNSGILTLMFIFILWKNKIHFNGVTYAALFLIAGFSFLGKNILNVWAIVLGVYLYAKYQKQKFSKYIYIALFGTAAAPIVTEIIFHFDIPLYIRLPFGILFGIGTGFILPPLSTHFLRIHQGYNLYNVGFTTGIIMTIMVALFKSFGYTGMTQMVWGSGLNNTLAPFLLFIFLTFIIIGFLTHPTAWENYKAILTYPGRLVSDFIILEGFSATLINIGINGILATCYILIVNGDLNGPTIGGIFTVAGFSAFGKHIKNITPIIIGVMLGSFLKIFSINDPSILLAALFGTALAPIAGEFGTIYGIIAGFIHSSVVLHVGELHAGLNLYNNGFSAGLVAAILVPLIEALRKDVNS